MLDKKSNLKNLINESKLIPTSLYAIASQSLQQEIEKDLRLKDPSPEIAQASILKFIQSH